MAATKRNQSVIAEVRARIKTSQLVERLQRNALGKLKNEMSLGQVRAASFLISKVIPDAPPEQPSDEQLMIALVRRLIVDKDEPQTIEGRSVELPALPEPEQTD